ncbi:MAG: VOC family protein [Nanoarchaeota archaeon]
MNIKELGHVVLYVTDIEIMSKFYRETLGFTQIASNKGMAVFSSGRTHHELLLIEIGGEVRRKSHPEPGLYHIGLKIGETDEELKKAIKELTKKGVNITGTSDHTVTHSLYITDPDGNELELYVDINNDWKKDPKKIFSPTKPLRI